MKAPNPNSNSIKIKITEEILNAAKQAEQGISINRTVASPYDILAGAIGEYCFAQYYYGDHTKAKVFETKGQTDFENGIEVKASAYPYRDGLNLLVRQDYAEKRKPTAYVQTIIDLPKRGAPIEVGMDCIIAGWATAEMIDNAPHRDFGDKDGQPAGYDCHYIELFMLNPIETLYTHLENV